MAEPKRATEPLEAQKEVTVEIDVDPKTKKITVKPDPFRVSFKAEQQVVWLCRNRSHDKHDSGCFTVEFLESPFAKSQSSKHQGHGALSGRANVPPGEKLYKYSVAVPDVGTLDPEGVVDP